MLQFAKRIAPLLRALDERVPLYKPVLTSDLIALFKAHSPLTTISFYPIQKRHTSGLHLRSTERSAVHIFYEACSEHDLDGAQPACVACQVARFVIAKELSHSLDCDGEMTPPDDVEEHLLNELLKGGWANPRVQSDNLAQVWAVELLVRYLSRRQLEGGGALGPSPKLTAARTSDDFSDLARQYGVPHHVIRNSFDPTYMRSMRDLRALIGLPVGEPWRPDAATPPAAGK